jgi:hypothetical protein
VRSAEGITTRQLQCYLNYLYEKGRGRVSKSFWRYFNTISIKIYKCIVFGSYLYFIGYPNYTF